MTYKRNISQKYIRPLLFALLCPLSTLAFAQNNSKNSPANLRLSQEAEAKNYAEALQFYTKGEFENSLQKARSFFEQTSQIENLRILVVANYIALGDTYKAMAHIKALLKKRPNYLPAIFFQARILRFQRKYAKAVRIVRQRLAQSRNPVPLRLSIASSYYKARQYANARKEIQKLLAIEPQNYYGMYLDGLIFLKQANYENAEFRLRNALLIQPTRKEDLLALYNNLGIALEGKALALERKRKYKAAKTLFTKAEKYYDYTLELNPNHQTAKANKKRISLR